MEQYRDKDVIVIGAGAAGMMAAITASQQGRRVLLLEKMEQPGRKLRITGKGRCNLTNTANLKDFLSHVGSDSRFMRNSFALFFNTQLMDFFESHGVPLVVERGSRVFPQSGKSLDIFLALINTIENDPRIDIRKSSPVEKLIMFEGKVNGVLLKSGEIVHARKVIVATGGKSYPSTGSTGDGYNLAAMAGHTVLPCHPSLVPLICEEELPPELIGFTLKNVGLSVTLANGKKVCDHFGELTFTEDGLGGPITLSTSRAVTGLIANNEKLTAHIDLKPAVEADTLDKRLISDLNSNGNRLLHDALRMWLPAELISLFFIRNKIERYTRLNQINGNERKLILRFLKDLALTITATHGWEEAIVTQGGVSLKEVNPKTMESKLVPGLYFAGEVLDLDADTGGYNLQLAFSTGYAAGLGTAQE